MIKIDKTDGLYKYLTGLGVENIDEEYLNLAQNGRYKIKDVLAYFAEIFHPSQTEEIKEDELEKILDYYVDLKKIKKLSNKELNEMLKKYKSTKDEKLKHTILNSQLKDVLYLCLNYKTLHKDADVQEIVQIANLGLMQALNKFNPDAKINFKDYIIYWVNKQITQEFKEDKNA